MSWLSRLFCRKQPAASPSAPVPGSAVGDVVITDGLLAKAGWARPEAWARVIAPAAARYGINTRNRVAAFLANVGHETGGGARLVESFNYDAAGLMRTWPRRFDAELAQKLGRGPGKPADQPGIAEVVYGGRMGNDKPGDGWRYRGRGLMQLTGKSNYEQFARTVGKPLDDALLAMLETEAGAAESAAHFWHVAGCNTLADTGDIAAVRRRVNGGLIGIDDVQARYRMALGVLRA